MACAFPNISKYAQPNILRVNLKEFSKCNHFLNQKVTGDTRNCKCWNIEQNKVLEEVLGHATSVEEADSNVLGQDPPSDQSIGCSLPPQMLPYLHTHTQLFVFCSRKAMLCMIAVTSKISGRTFGQICYLKKVLSTG